MNFLPGTSGFGLGQQLSGPTLAGDLRQLADWQRRHLPCIHTALGQQTLAWLIRHNSLPKPFAELVSWTTFSTTSVRHLVNQLVALNLVEPRTNPVTRRGYVVATPKLKARLEEYAERMTAIVARHRAIGLSSSPMAGRPKHAFDPASFTGIDPLKSRPPSEPPPAKRPPAP